jgi:uncharacterized iron-regulated membrane protein
MAWNTRKDFRKLHRWGSLLIALPFLIVLITGLLLQVKKEFNWIQPATQTGSRPGASITLEDVLVTSKTIPELEVSSWDQIDRLDVRPGDGIIKIRGKNGWEAQIDAHTAEVLLVAPRRSDVIEALHDGSWFHDSAKLWIFLPAAVIVTMLWVTGIYLFFLPYFAQRRNRKKLTERRRRRKNTSLTI